MSPPSYQTIRLTRGKHKSPEDGACVMELASMLADEPFSDRPASVCPVIAATLRAYNDSLDDDRRQHLYPYAAKVVGTRASSHVERLRAERLAGVVENGPRRRGSWLLRWGITGASLMIGTLSPDQVGARAVNSLLKHSDEKHAAVLALVDELLEIGTDPPPSGPGVGQSRSHVHACLSA